MGGGRAAQDRPVSHLMHCGLTATGSAYNGSRDLYMLQRLVNELLFCCWCLGILSAHRTINL